MDLDAQMQCINQSGFISILCKNFDLMSFVLKMVEATASEVGCAQQQCSLYKDQPQTITLAVCLYKPGTRYLHRKPYKSGLICDDCPKGFTCRHKQCINASASVRILTSSSTKLLPILTLNLLVPLLCLFARTN
uniref:SCP domain-containing protein n=1 Tax=Mesocestoides corti TaxID=53468 RepID=A0A5K3F6R7_MESCO